MPLCQGKGMEPVVGWTQPACQWRQVVRTNCRLSARRASRSVRPSRRRRSRYVRAGGYTHTWTNAIWCGRRFHRQLPWRLRRCRMRWWRRTPQRSLPGGLGRRAARIAARAALFHGEAGLPQLVGSASGIERPNNEGRTVSQRTDTGSPAASTSSGLRTQGTVLVTWSCCSARCTSATMAGVSRRGGVNRSPSADCGCL